MVNPMGEQPTPWLHRRSWLWLEDISSFLRDAVYYYITPLQIMEAQ